MTRLLTLACLCLVAVNAALSAVNLPDTLPRPNVNQSGGLVTGYIGPGTHNIDSEEDVPEQNSSRGVDTVFSVDGLLELGQDQEGVDDESWPRKESHTPVFSYTLLANDNQTKRSCLRSGTSFGEEASKAKVEFVCGTVANFSIMNLNSPECNDTCLFRMDANRYLVGYLWLLLISGTLGNLFTMLAIIYVRMNNSDDNLGKLFKKRIVNVIFQLSFLNFIYCSVGFTHFLWVFYSDRPGETISPLTCSILGSVRNVTAISVFITMAVMALAVRSEVECAKCMNANIRNYDNHFEHDFFAKTRNGVVQFVLCVALAFAAVAQDIFNDGEHGIGWTCTVYGCDIKCPPEGCINTLHFYVILFCGLVIVFGYFPLFKFWLKERTHFDKLFLYPATVTILYALHLTPLVLVGNIYAPCKMVVTPGPTRDVVSIVLSCWYFTLYVSNFLISLVHPITLWAYKDTLNFLKSRANGLCKTIARTFRQERSASQPEMEMQGDDNRGFHPAE